MTQLRSHYPRIKAAGSEILQISFYPPDRTRNWARRFELPWLLAVDETRQTYWRYGLGAIQSSDTPVAASVMVGIKSLIKLGKVPEHLMHTSQLGGYFVVDSTGKIVYAHSNKNAMDNPPLGDILSALHVPTNE